MNKRAFVRTLLATVALGAWVPTVRADEPVKAVYHFTQGVEEAAHGLNNIRNHLDADPTAKIVVVANGKAGVQFILEDAVDHNGKPFAERISALANRGWSSASATTR
ncbi:DsrE family protein [Hydrogenophilus thermoluteolus]|uniref:DsrE family protein n=1 Tax=Hydrogenophilus thermoluteolus TaxID=297 RepID=UPI003F667714